MANTPEGKRLTELYRLSQVQMQAQMTARAKLLAPILSVSDLGRSGELYAAAMESVAYDGFMQEVAESRRYMQAYTYAETGREAVIVDPVFDSDAVREDMLIRGPIGAKQRIAKGVAPEVAVSKATEVAAAGLARDVLNAGRELLMGSSAQTLEQLGRGRRKGGWRRVTDGKPCAFCAMLAGRGAVYSQETSVFHVHDYCGCTVEPVFGEWQPTPLENKWRQAYLDAAKQADRADKRRVAPHRKDGPEKDFDSVLWRMRRNNPELFHDGWKTPTK